jgi:cytochrome c556
MTKAMADAGQTALKAANDKSPEGILAAGETINKTCDDCHQKYQR